MRAAVAEVAGLPELVDDPRFRTQRDRVANQTVLAGILQAKFGGRRTSHWLRELRARGVPCGPVNTYGQMLADDHVTATGLVQEQKVPAPETFLHAALWAVGVAAVGFLFFMSRERDFAVRLT